MKAKPNVNVSALAAGVTSLFAVIGALAATGVIGRLERNEPDALIAAVFIVLLGSAMLVLAGLPITTDRSEIFAILVGTGLTVIGIGWAIAAGIKDAGRSERPRLTVALDSKGTVVKGKVRAANLKSDRTLVVLVEGLNVSEAAKKNWQVTNLAQYYVGPDGDGKVDMPLAVPVPADEFTHVGVKAKTRETDTCSQYPRRRGSEPFKEEIEGVDAGCAVVRLPGSKPAAAVDAQSKPKVSVSWTGARLSAGRVRLRVVATGGGERVAILAAGRRGKRLRQLLRAVNPVGKDGTYRANIAVRAGRGYRRLCARADVLGAGERAPTRVRRCPLPRSLRIGPAGDELAPAR
jgi:hypothetical protein